MDDAPRKRPVRMTWLLAVLPLWLAGSGAVAMWYYFHREEQNVVASQQRFAKEVSIPLLADDLRKIVEIVGARDASSESGGRNLTRIASMIEGALGPGNTGYEVSRRQGPAAWPLLEVTLAGKKPKAPAVWVITTYDSRPGSKGAEANASGVAATLAAAQALADTKPDHPVKFAFLPHFNDAESPVLDTVSTFIARVKATGPVRAALCVEAMGAGESLWLSTRDTTALPLSKIGGLGAVHGADVVCLSEDSDLASVLFELDLPAARVATRGTLAPEEADDRMPFAPTLAASSGRLIELIRRCAGADQAPPPR